MKKQQKSSQAQEDFAEASRLREEGNFRAAIPLFARAAKRGDASAQLMLGYCFDTGSGIARSRDNALHWYRKAAAAGEGAAASNIAAIFLAEGKRAVAMRWFRRAVGLGLSEALLDIAQLQGGPSARGRAARASLRRLLRHKTLIPRVREVALRLMATD